MAPARPAPAAPRRATGEPGSRCASRPRSGAAGRPRRRRAGRRRSSGSARPAAGGCATGASRPSRRPCRARAPVVHEIREAQQVIGLVGTAERRREHRVKDGQARGAQRGRQRRAQQRAVSGRHSRHHGPRGKHQHAGAGQQHAERHHPRQPAEPGAIRHMWLSRTIAGQALRVVDERAAHVERLRPCCAWAATWSGAGSAPAADSKASSETAPVSFHLDFEVEARRARSVARLAFRRAAETRWPVGPSAPSRAAATSAQSRPRSCSRAATRPTRRDALEEQLQLLVLQEFGRVVGNQLEPKDLSSRGESRALERDRDGSAARRARDERRAQRHAGARRGEHDPQQRAEREDEEERQAPRRHESGPHRSRE